MEQSDHGARRAMWLAIFAAVGLIAASASTWVHYRILNDPLYASFCDVNSTLNCTEAYTSRYGAIAGVHRRQAIKKDLDRVDR